MLGDRREAVAGDADVLALVLDGHRLAAPQQRVAAERDDDSHGVLPRIRAIHRPELARDRRAFGPATRVRIASANPRHVPSSRSPGERRRRANEAHSDRDRTHDRRRPSTPPETPRRQPRAASGSAVATALDHGQHHRRRHLQPADVARRLRSDQPRVDGPDDRRRARARAAVRRAVAAAARPTAARTRTHASRSATSSASRTRGRTGSPRGPATRRSPSGWVLYVEEFVNKGHNRLVLGPARARRPVDPRRDQPLRRQEHGLGAGRARRS